MYPEAKSVGLWLKHGWHVALAYMVGFAALVLVLSWHPDAKRVKSVGVAPAVAMLARV